MSEPTTRPHAGTQRDYDDFAAAYERRKLYVNQPFNGSTKFINWMLTILAMLIVAAICGEVVVYGQVQALQSTVNYMLRTR